MSKEATDERNSLHQNTARCARCFALLSHVLIMLSDDFVHAEPGENGDRRAIAHMVSWGRERAECSHIIRGRKKFKVMSRLSKNVSLLSGKKEQCKLTGDSVLARMIIQNNLGAYIEKQV